jgi:hypothetical protein
MAIQRPIQVPCLAAAPASTAVSITTAATTTHQHSNPNRYAQGEIHRDNLAYDGGGRVSDNAVGGRTSLHKGGKNNGHHRGEGDEMHGGFLILLVLRDI